LHTHVFFNPRLTGHPRISYFLCSKDEQALALQKEQTVNIIN
jgi:hypothetical protein